MVKILSYLLLALIIFPSNAEEMKRLYQKLEVNCIQCHVNPATDAPLIGDKNAWAAVLKRSRTELLTHIYRGKAGMPPLGYCSSCSENDFLILTRIMAGLPATPNPSTAQKDW